MVQVNLKVRNGADVEDLEITDDAESPTGRALPILDAEVRDHLGTDGATPPSIPGTGVRGWLRAIYDRLTVGITVDTGLTTQTDALTDAQLRDSDVGVTVSNFPASTTVTGEVEIKNDAGDPIPVSGPLTDGELRASAPAVKDDYQAGECLAEQTGAGAVLTFTFSAAVQLVHVEANGAEDDVARVDPFGGTPTSTQGFRAADAVPLYLPITATVVKVWAPVDMVVTVNGFRRA